MCWDGIKILDRNREIQVVITEPLPDSDEIYSDIRHVTHYAGQHRGPVIAGKARRIRKKHRKSVHTACRRIVERR